jgi:hypothetical protein
MMASEKSVYLSTAAAFAAACSAALTLVACDPGRSLDCMPHELADDETLETLEADHPEPDHPEPAGEPEQGDAGPEQDNGGHWPNPWTWIGSCNTAKTRATNGPVDLTGHQFAPCTWPLDLDQAFEGCALAYGVGSSECEGLLADLDFARGEFQWCWDAAALAPEPYRAWSLIGVKSAVACNTVEAHGDLMSEGEHGRWSAACASNCDPDTWSSGQKLTWAHLLDPDYCDEHPGTQGCEY